MTGCALIRPVPATAWELRGALALRRSVRLTLSERCDGIHPRPDGQRVLEGIVSRVSPTDAFAVLAGRHIPLGEILAIHRPHFAQGEASDPADPLEREAEAAATKLETWAKEGAT